MLDRVGALRHLSVNISVRISGVRSRAKTILVSGVINLATTSVIDDHLVAFTIFELSSDIS